jgi:hypothetical protein
MSDGHITAALNDYTVTFHPAFASRCVITGANGERHEVYKQARPHKLNGETHPKKHVIRLQGGKHGRDITLEVHDPKHAIKELHLALYDDHDPAQIGNGKLMADVGTAETFTTFNTADTCPPVCEDGP